MPLKVIIVGAGIAGLCAAIALRQAGHEVEAKIFEKSKFATETGAALIISPNGARVLSSLNFSFHKARAVEVTSWRVLRGDNQAQLISVDLSSARDKFGAGIWAVHRVDLHNELLRLALDADLPGCPIRLHLSSEVIKASPAGQIYLKDGTVHIADLLIGADGLHSMMKSAVNVKSRGPISTGLSAFRFLIETNKLKASESIATILNNKNHSATLLADVTDTTKERHIIWYPCRE
ncbi:hypothetical protein E4T50_03868 [Aureobasidium sp. EXF-12298]|nr:hypothetical protein E4T50_03868 [Aureobasidium sp. EXF-12298]KAI4781334.1 hypothetical protein E4T52_03714 [Aureobasidium sp. EXF-3400]